MIRKYSKKPVVIEAVKWVGSNLNEIQEFCKPRLSYNLATGHGNCLVISTLEGDHFADVGDMIIKGIKGECYPCKPDIFAATYEEIEEG